MYNPALAFQSEIVDNKSGDPLNFERVEQVSDSLANALIKESDMQVASQFFDDLKTKAKEVTVDLLIENGMASKKDIVKVLARGELKAKVNVTAHKFSASAVEAIEKLGGKVITL